MPATLIHAEIPFPSGNRRLVVEGVLDRRLPSVTYVAHEVPGDHVEWVEPYPLAPIDRQRLLTNWTGSISIDNALAIATMHAQEFLANLQIANNLMGDADPANIVRSHDGFARTLPWPWVVRGAIQSMRETTSFCPTAYFGPTFSTKDQYRAIKHGQSLKSLLPHRGAHDAIHYAGEFAAGGYFGAQLLNRLSQIPNGCDDMEVEMATGIPRHKTTAHVVVQSTDYLTGYAAQTLLYVEVRSLEDIFDEHVPPINECLARFGIPPLLATTDSKLRAIEDVQNRYDRFRIAGNAGFPRWLDNPSSNPQFANRQATVSLAPLS